MLAVDVECRLYMMCIAVNFLSVASKNMHPFRYSPSNY